jgi:hypothetical protein
MGVRRDERSGKLIREQKNAPPRNSQAPTRLPAMTAPEGRSPVTAASVKPGNGAPVPRGNDACGPPHLACSTVRLRRRHER